MYSRKTDLPSVVFLDVKFHPTMPNHVIVLSTMTLPQQTKINTLVPIELLDVMDQDIKDNYFNKAKNYHIKENRAGKLHIGSTLTNENELSLVSVSYSNHQI